MRLIDLSVDLLAHILDGEASFGAIEFWKTGCPSLRSKLMKGGIRHLNLVSFHRKSTGTWPKCIKHFRLLSLRLVHHGPLGSPSQLHEELLALHCGIKSLELDLPHAGEAFFFDILPSNQIRDIPVPHTISQPSSASFTGDLLPLKLDEHSYRPLHEVLASLERLKLSCKEAVLSEGSGDLIAFLPPLLTSLEVENMPFVRDSMRFDRVRPQLTRLTLPKQSINATTLRSLPSHLVNMGDCFTDNALIALRDDASLLPNLIRFPHSGLFLPGIGTYSSFSIRTESGKWPDNMDYLCLLSFPPSIRNSLPKNLLELYIGEYAFQATADWIQHVLPPTLTSLSLRAIDWKTMDATRSFWPPALTRLTCSHMPKGWRNYFLLPRALNNLHITADEDDPSDTQKYSDSIVRENSINSLETGSRWSNIRESLVKRYEGTEWKSWCSEYVSQVDDGKLLGFPLELEEIYLSGTFHYTAGRIILPPLITKLSIYIRIRDSAFFDLLPPSLTCLDLNSPEYHHENTDITDWDMLRMNDPMKSALYNLKHLRDMKLTRIASMDLLFKFLPRSLQYLFLYPGSHYLSAVYLKELPNLLSLQLVCSELIGPSNWTLALPRTLHTLILDYCPIRGADVANLPPNLRHLKSASMVNLYPQHLLTLPKTLHRAEEWRMVSVPMPSEEVRAINSKEMEIIQSEFAPLWRVTRIPLEELQGYMCRIRRGNGS